MIPGFLSINPKDTSFAKGFDDWITSDYDRKSFYQNGHKFFKTLSSHKKLVLNSENLIKYKKSSNIKIKRQNYKIKIFENLLDGSENFALIKGDIKKNKNPRVRVISSNIVKNYLMGEKFPNLFNRAINHFKNHKDCVLIFIKDANLKSVSETLKSYKSRKYYKKGEDKLIKNYGIGAQIIKTLNIKNMILVTRSRKKVVGLDGYGIKIAKQEIIKWKKKF